MKMQRKKNRKQMFELNLFVCIKQKCELFSDLYNSFHELANCTTHIIFAVVDSVFERLTSDMDGAKHISKYIRVEKI